MRRRQFFRATGLAVAGAAAGRVLGRSQSAEAAASTVVVNSRWVAPVFQQINYNLLGYAGRTFTTSSNNGWAHHSDFPGGGSPQTQQSLTCRWEDLTDYFQTPAPWPTVMGIMNNVNTTGPGVTGQPNNLAALYLGVGAGMSSDNDSHGLPMNYRAMTAPSSLASLPVPAGTWSGTPTMADGSAAKPVIPVIGWNLGGTSLIDIANGLHDTDTIIPAAQACKNWAADANGNPAYTGQPGGQVFIRLMHEFNGNWAPYCPGNSAQPSTCSASDFVNAWKHIVNVFAAQGATNARWVWAPNVVGSKAANGTHSGWVNGSGTTALCYPGDAYVDYVGLDGYNKSVPNWTTFTNVFQTSYNWMYNGDAFTNGPITTTKPMIITEFSSLEDDNFTSPPQTKAQFITDIGTVVPASFPNVEGVMLWHSNVGDGLEWPMTSSAAAVSAWNSLARNAAFQGKPDLIQGVTQALAGGGGGGIINRTASGVAVTNGSTSKTTCTLTLPTVAAGDVLYLVNSGGSADTFSKTGAGTLTTLLGPNTITGSAGTVWGYLLRYVAAAGDTGKTITATGSNRVGRSMACSPGYEGVNAATPEDGTGKVTTTSKPVVTRQITTTHANCWCVQLCTSVTNSGATYSSHPGTQRADAGGSGNLANVSDSNGSVGPAGTVAGGGSFGLTASAESSAAYTVTVNPA